MENLAFKDAFHKLVFNLKKFVSFFVQELFCKHDVMIWCLTFMLLPIIYTCFGQRKNCRAVIFPAVLSSMPSGDPCCGDAKKRLEKCNISIGQIDLMLMTNHAYWFFSHIYSRTRQIKTIKIIWMCNYNFLVDIGNLSLFHISMRIWCDDFILRIFVCCKAIPNFE